MAVADLADPAALGKALEGSKGAYLLSPPNMGATDFLADRTAFLEKLCDGVKRGKPASVVFLSSIGAQHPGGTGPIVTVHRAEQMLRGLAPSVTFVRAAYFVENAASVVPLAKAQGVLPHFGSTSVRFPQVCARDIGQAAAGALTSPASGTRVVELAGREDWSMDDVAAALAGLLGKPVKAVSAPLEAAEAGLRQAGVPPEMARLYAEMYAGIATGLVAWEKPGSVVRGATPLAEALRPIV